MTKTLRKIMLIDDDTITNMLNEYLLKNMNLCDEVIIKTSGDEALGYFKENPIEASDIDLIFLDVNMPGIGGFDFIKKYRNIGLLKHAKVVLLTTIINKKEVIQAETSDIAAYIDKPLSEEKLKSFFRKYQLS